MRTTLLILLLCSLCITAGCDREKPSSSSSTSTSADDSKTPLPDHYGLFAVVDGKPQHVQPGDPPAEFPATAEFIFFDKRVPTMSTDVHFFVLPRSLIGRELPPRSKPFVRRSANEFDPWSIPLEAKVKPIANQTEMVRIVSAEKLDPGCYALEDWAQFFVDQKQLDRNLNTIIGTWQASYPSTPSVVRGAREPPLPSPVANFRFSSNGAYTANVWLGPNQLKEKGTWKIDGKNLVTTTTASNDGRPAGTADTVEILQLDAATLIFKAPTGKGGVIKHTFHRVN
jgi:hypothetical protein